MKVSVPVEEGEEGRQPEGGQGPAQHQPLILQPSRVSRKRIWFSFREIKKNQQQKTRNIIGIIFSVKFSE